MTITQVDRTALGYALYDAEQRTLAEIDVVRDALGRAVQAATMRNSKLADEVRAQTGELDRRYAEVHERLMALIAVQAPLSDLRLAIALLQANDRLARIGALTIDIAVLCQRLPDGVQLSSGQLERLDEMTELVDEQLTRAKAALANRDPKGVSRLRKRDLGITEHEQHGEAAFFVALIARALERIGDNAVDIAAQGEFAAEGRLRPAIG